MEIVEATMPQDWTRIEAVIHAGHQVASGRSPTSPYPAGTIALQTPVFLALGLDLRPYFPGTLNLNIAPLRFALGRPAHRFEAVRWTLHHPPETFSFYNCRLTVDRRGSTNRYDGLVYYPHPETKRSHFQAPTVLEVLAPRIAGLTYGHKVGLETLGAQIQLIAE
jgi:hypothetical protein